MPITDFLERNAKIYPSDVALVEVNPEKQPAKDLTWREYSLIETAKDGDKYRREMTWREFDVKANRFANLLFTIRKVSIPKKIPHINGNSYDVFVPDLEKFDAVKTIANAYRKGNGVDIVDHLVSDGLVFEDENIRVTALHNDHLREADTEDWHSYSYLIEAEGKRIVFSGDVHYPHELDPLLEGGCDLLIMETGHHKVADVCEFAKSRGVKKLIFNHHGREILRSVSDAEKVIEDSGVNGSIANDGDVIEM